MARGATYDYAIVGGGLQGGLLALALAARRPRARIAIVERGATLGGNHTWCFHAGDLPARTRDYVLGLVEWSWPGYSVAFPGHTRELSEPYSGASSERLDRVVKAMFSDRAGCDLLLGTSASHIAERTVTLQDGRTLTADIVIDARGPRPGPADSEGYQKFVGLELDIAAGHGLERPILMDATVPQTDGYRFFYCLPLSPTRLLVEDTYFSLTTELDEPALERGILDYAADRGFGDAVVVRSECGVLPLPWKGTPPVPSLPLVAGYRGGWFHPATGYSFPVALRLADAVATSHPDRLLAALRPLHKAHQKQVKFCYRLNYMLFHFLKPGHEWNVFARFYRLPDKTIRRFYALETTFADRARLVIGRPPRGFSVRGGGKSKGAAKVFAAASAHLPGDPR